MIEIDGSFGEGGGEILRTSLTLSAITQKPFRIYNIRSNRKNPGLQMQHLTAVRLMKKLCNADTKGDFLGSKELLFIPREIQDNLEITENVQTAGSTTLIAVASIPVIINKNIKIKLIGGTDVPKSPTIDYLRMVYLGILNKIGINGKISLIKRGHYPKGGGIIELSNFEGEGEKFEIDSIRKINYVKGISHVSSLPSHIAERQAKSAKQFLSSFLGNIDIDIDIDVRQGESEGSGITLAAYGDSILGSDSLGEKGKRAEKVGEEAGEKLIEDIQSKAGVDRYMSDMLMLYASLYGGHFTGSMYTLHAKTNAEVIKKFLNVEIKISGNNPFSFYAKV
ncbi:RNA 3'-terminal phosphate cyclase [Acidianus manzaensis]|uniref:RNA 3'-terminal phosphate cyclase n=1 Tax=Acidianus manzaensis TaxID=282676 RepID=A0A1W6JXW4_9CREN|nr:RNA 3'-terminal phosphate cyclase [Acidianus manzaensis]ARM75085.1 RNA 3'-phosphate cyclase [Acidianus manzaensis]